MGQLSKQSSVVANQPAQTPPPFLTPPSQYYPSTPWAQEQQQTQPQHPQQEQQEISQQQAPQPVIYPTIVIGENAYPPAKQTLSKQEKEMRKAKAKAERESAKRLAAIQKQQDFDLARNEWSKRNMDDQLTPWGTSLGLGLGGFVASLTGAYTQAPPIAAHAAIDVTLVHTALGIASNLVAVPLFGAIFAALLNQQIQEARIRTYLMDERKKYDLNHFSAPCENNLPDPITPEIRKMIWERSTKPLLINMGAALLGAQLFTFVLQESGWGHTIAQSMGHLHGHMPWQIHFILSLASGLGMAIFLTASACSQAKQLGNELSTSAKVGLLATGFMLGMAAHACAMIPGLNLANNWNLPGYAANLLAATGTGVAATGLFVALDKSQPAFDRAGYKLNTWSYGRRDKDDFEQNHKIDDVFANRNRNLNELC